MATVDSATAQRALDMALAAVGLAQDDAGGPIFPRHGQGHEVRGFGVTARSAGNHLGSAGPALLSRSLGPASVLAGIVEKFVPRSPPGPPMSLLVMALVSVRGIGAR